MMSRGREGKNLISAYDLLTHHIAQNQSFVQIEIGIKIKQYKYSPTLETLLFL